jgi:biopolymer transport protein ExbD
MKNKFSNKKKLSEEFALQITSMADIFVILLVFLLKSFSLSIVNIAPSENTVLPEATTSSTIKETLKIEIKADTILVDQKPVLKLKNFGFQNSQEGTSQALMKALKEQRKPNPLPNMDSNLLVMADERTPYTTLETVMSSAAQAGFVDLQLVVVNPE